MSAVVYEYGVQSDMPEINKTVVTWHESEEEAQQIVRGVNSMMFILAGDNAPGETYLIRRVAGTDGPGERVVEETAHASS